MRRSVAGLCVLAAALLASPQVKAARPADLGRLHVLLLNGGGNPEENFKSHLLHVQEMTTVLLGRGLDAERLTVMASDGQNARPDVAVRQNDPETFWLLEGTGLERALREPITYENTTIPGTGGKPVPVSPATRASVSRFFQAARARMRPGDTLLVYVTDHGKDHPRDPRLNHITLWGRGEGLTVRQLAGELERLPPGVRVVTLMSQCFSGGFAHLMDVRRRAGLPSGAACGYFATTADRPAYGCYPEANTLDRSGHAFAVLNALRTTGSLPAAHNLVLLRDQTPDVPLRTVDAFLAERLRRAARAAGTDEQSFADLQLKQSPAQRAIARMEAGAAGGGGIRPATAHRPRQPAANRRRSGPGAAPAARPPRAVADRAERHDPRPPAALPGRPARVASPPAPARPAWPHRSDPARAGAAAAEGAGQVRRHPADRPPPAGAAARAGGGGHGQRSPSRGPGGGRPAPAHAADHDGRAQPGWPGRARPAERAALEALDDLRGSATAATAAAASRSRPCARPAPSPPWTRIRRWPRACARRGWASRSPTCTRAPGRGCASVRGRRW